MGITTPRVLVELNGADPWNTYTNLPGIQVEILDWDEVRVGEVSVTSLIQIHDRWENEAPRTARSIRDILRTRGVNVPSEYNSDFDKE